MFCHTCGNELEEGQPICNWCGAAVSPTSPVKTEETVPVPPIPAPTQDKNAWTWVLALALVAVLVFAVVPGIIHLQEQNSADSKDSFSAEITSRLDAEAVPTVVNPIRPSAEAVSSPRAEAKSSPSAEAESRPSAESYQIVEPIVGDWTSYAAMLDDGDVIFSTALTLKVKNDKTCTVHSDEDGTVTGGWILDEQLTSESNQLYYKLTGDLSGPYMVYDPYAEGENYLIIVVPDAGKIFFER